MYNFTPKQGLKEKTWLNEVKTPDTQSSEKEPVI